MVDGINTQYLEAGTGSPVLLLHGHEQSATTWRWVIPTLARTHRVLALSRPGHGETDPAVGGYAPGRDLTPFVADFLSTLGIGLLDLVGNSVGGSVALRLALTNPAAVRTLTLVASAGLGREVHPLLALDTMPGIGELAIMLSRIPGGDVQRTTMSAAMLFAKPWRVPAEFFTEQHDLGRRPGQLEASTAMARALFDMTGHIMLDQLHTLTMPTLVVWGENDYVLPRSTCQVRGRPVTQGAAVAVPRLRAPAPRGAIRQVRRGAQRVAHRRSPARRGELKHVPRTRISTPGAGRQSNRRTERPANRTEPHASPVPTGTGRPVREFGGLPQPGRRLRPADRGVRALA